MMLVIRDLELKRTFVGGDFRKTKYVTTAEVKIGSAYNKATVTLTDEQTAKAVEFILGLIRESLTVDLEIPEPVEEVYSPSPEVSARLSEMEPI